MSAPQVGVLLAVSYDGQPFHGMALQANARTVAGELLGAIRCMDPGVTGLRHVSRTDAGVHARQQWVSFDAVTPIPPRGWVLGLSRHLPAQIVVRSAAQVPVGFDARGHVVDKTYRYRLHNSALRDPFLVGRAWQVSHRLNQNLMAEAAADLCGTHDFAAFRGASDGRTCTVRTISSARFLPDPGFEHTCLFELTGDRFLYHMVRIIVGTLVDIGRGRLKRSSIATALASLNRADLGITAPPDGLTLFRVRLDRTFDDLWPTLPTIEDGVHVDDPNTRA